MILSVTLSTNCISENIKNNLFNVSSFANNAIHRQSKSFEQRYSIAFHNALQHQLPFIITSFEYIFKPIVYSLPKSCDHSSSIRIKFKIGYLSENHEPIYIDNVYLYYNVNKNIFMDSESDWIITSETVVTGFISNEYCETDGYCYQIIMFTFQKYLH